MTTRPLRLLSLFLSLWLALAGGTAVHALCATPACDEACADVAAAPPNAVWGGDAARCDCDAPPRPRCDVGTCQRSPDAASTSAARRLGEPSHAEPLTLPPGVCVDAAQSRSGDLFAATAGPPPSPREPTFRRHCALLC